MVKIRFFALKLVLLALSIFINFSLFSQSTISSAGGQGLSGAGKIDYTIGQIDFNNYSTTTGKVNEGVQQPFEILLLKEENSEEIETPLVFPNPVYDKIIISFNKSVIPAYYEIIDLNGKKQLSNKFETSTTEIFINELPGSVYFLKIYNGSFQSKTFKLIKINKS